MSQQAQLVGFTHESSKTDEWFTPPWIFDRLGLSFYLDPAMPMRRLPWVPTEHYFTAVDNGLAQPWAGRVWLNPPYGQQTGAWLRRFVEHGDGVALVFARPDTGWFHEAVSRADGVCFVRGRIRFVRPDGKDGGSPGAGSMLLAMGDVCAQALQRSDLGTNMRVDGGLKDVVFP